MSAESIQQIHEFLPHRYPFLLVDRIKEVDLEAENGATIRVLKNVTINEEFFNGHFPGHPVMPGVLTLEAMAQAAGLLGLTMLGEKRKPTTLYYFAGADHVRFKRPIGPGDQIILEARFVSGRRGMWKFDCRALIDDKVACAAEITCAERDLEHT
ncbi:MAG: 3-hydroxyacyl-[acyl-carrier-protein] dehydratase FabZ [Oceanospirillaceae bacterium]|uniref:3-hydroxyacyl-ACP dehydratase FabZ n=1 Tax=unclassified Thalassolituus TaxID=2624967 RepID=UPI000C09A913|nr:MULTISPECIES: 3-hydroxyacyl-ACP dehydratase FabZ [unclassified Thalassolituus]MAK90667.1 3-hydroxyacyl-[acyl-carrier-protein] dehydratase FabZ [Thalassolituus sp.]MBS54043.1 3-hydroxyacyl-[acyl-carrier-protein] dehydratase FabZ [Oceanospirillaceae bacterium]|tara:strand:+ start:417 stop:881 length:465 start_codon:yes stop_codon:yes gene_type:complete